MEKVHWGLLYLIVALTSGIYLYVKHPYSLAKIKCSKQHNFAVAL